MEKVQEIYVIDIHDSFMRVATYVVDLIFLYFSSKTKKFPRIIKLVRWESFNCFSVVKAFSENYINFVIRMNIIQNQHLRFGIELNGIMSEEVLFSLYDVVGVWSYWRRKCSLKASCC